MTIRVGVIGLGSMGQTHLNVYAQLPDARIVAISDADPKRLSGEAKAGGNIEGQAQGAGDLSDARRYDDGHKLIADPDVDLVDICLWTPLHLEYARAALAAGKHVMVEKPLARTFADSQELVRLADEAAAKGKFTMVGMCMRFWPGWTWLKKVVDEQTYGAVKSATFRRVASHPGGGFYLDGDRCGGAILDLHIHDVDFIQYLFGLPRAVTTAGYSKETTALDHVVTRYHYDQVPLVIAEGGWAMSPGFGFQMQYTVNFEKATAVFDIGAAEPLKLFRPDQPAEAVELESGMGYDHEIAYFLDCIQKGRKPAQVTPADAAQAVRIVEAEVESARTGQTVMLA